jgi:vitamin B12 transporter
MNPCFPTLPALLAGCLLLAVAVSLPAAEAPVVVTATRLPTPRDEVGSSVTVITATDIERRQYRSVTDALRSVPGLSVIPSGGGIGKLTVVFSRGTESNHTLFLLDGIELNDPAGTDGAIDLSNIYIDDVERIEILNGPQGTLYGSDALGAVIQVFTRRGTGAATAWGRMETGSFNTFSQSAGVGAGQDRLSWTLNVQHTDTDGVSALGSAFRQSNGTLDNDRHENINLGTRIDYELSETASIDFSGRYTRTDNDLDLNNSFVSDDSDSHGRQEQLLLGVNGRISLLEGASEHRLGLSYTATDRRDIDSIDTVNSADSSFETNRGWKRKIELQNDYYAFEHHVITAGFETEEDTVRSSVNAAFLDFFNAPASISSTVSADLRNNAVYLQDQFTFDELTGTAGVRIDKHERFKHETTWRVALSRHFPDLSTRIRGSIATGFKAPTANQLFVDSVTSFGLFTGNPNLQPETSRGWELGADRSFAGDRASAGITWYQQRIRNLITFNSTFTSNENRDRVKIRGAEAYVDGRVGETLSARLGASYTSSKDANTGENLLRRPLRKASLVLDYAASAKTQLGLETVYTGPRYDIDAVSFARKRRGGYSLVNLTASHAPSRNFTLHARVNNLTDKDYEEPDGFAQPGTGVFFGFTASH